MSKSIESFPYRPEIDGLRAVAVSLVVLFHAGFGFPGGYVGVDVFFVISGYLITALVRREFERGQFSLAGFWERRARRILPALAAVVVATLVAGWFLLLPREYAALGKSAAFQAVFAANFYFWRTNLGGYFAGDANEMPLLHTWSLAVEEQFYVLLPITLLGLARFSPRRQGPIWLILCAAGGAASLLAGWYWLRTGHRVLAFYLLPARAWELLLGSALAVLPAIPARPWFRELLACLGLAGILLPACWYSDKTPFPGLAALPPCLGAAGIIWGTTPGTLPSRNASLGRLLALPPLVFVGLISYSLYLWHWPIFAFAKYRAAGEPLSPPTRALLLLLAGVLAVLSWRWIETPFRRRRICASQPGIYAFAALSLLAVLLGGGAILLLHGLPGRLPAALRNALATNPEDDLLFAREMTTEDIAAEKLVPFGKIDPTAPVDVLVWGDSHAMAALPAFDLALRRRGLSGRAALHSATAPLLGYWLETPSGLGREAPRFNESILSYLQKKKIRHAVLIAHWIGYQTAWNSTNPVSTITLEQGLLSTISRLASLGCQTWIMLDVPHQQLNVGLLLRSRQLELPDLNQPRFCAKPTRWNGLSGEGEDFPARLTAAGARLLDARRPFLDEKKELYRIVVNEVVLYRDEHHLTKRGAELMLVPVLEQSFLPFL